MSDANLHESNHMYFTIVYHFFGDRNRRRQSLHSLLTCHPLRHQYLQDAVALAEVLMAYQGAVSGSDVTLLQLRVGSRRGAVASQLWEADAACFAMPCPIYSSLGSVLVQRNHLYMLGFLALQ